MLTQCLWKSGFCMRTMAVWIVIGRSTKHAAIGRRPRNFCRLPTLLESLGSAGMSAYKPLLRSTSPACVLTVLTTLRSANVRRATNSAFLRKTASSSSQSTQASKARMQNFLPMLQLNMDAGQRSGLAQMCPYPCVILKLQLAIQRRNASSLMNLVGCRQLSSVVAHNLQAHTPS
jgi:hypothetical protein